MDEARLDASDHGRKLGSPGWFVTSLDGCAWRSSERLGPFSCVQREIFTQPGRHAQVLQPGRAARLSRREGAREDLMALHGEALLLVEGEERPLGIRGAPSAIPWTMPRPGTRRE